MDEGIAFHGIRVVVEGEEALAVYLRIGSVASESVIETETVQGRRLGLETGLTHRCWGPRW